MFERISAQRPNASTSAALVTMTNSEYLNCTVHVLASAREMGWNYPILILTHKTATFQESQKEALLNLGVDFVETSPALDDWLNKSHGRYNFRKPDVIKFRKLELFFNPTFRFFDRLVYIDSDGVVGAPLDPLVHAAFPAGVSVVMRQNDVSVGKRSFWETELDLQALGDRDRANFESRFPNRPTLGASCWFIVDTRALAPVSRLLSESKSLLRAYRSAFRYNDQTLMNLLFYNEMETFPWCTWNELRMFNSTESLGTYCRRSMGAQRWLYGKLTFMYRHMAPFERAQCRLTKQNAQRSSRTA